MAKKQLKKINQPKRYLQGGSNMSSVSMMRQNPYYLGQVGQEAAQEDLITSQNQIFSKRQQALAKKQALKDAQDQQLDSTVQNSSTQLIQAAAADKKAGNLGKFMLPGVASSSGIVAPTLQSSIAANTVRTGVSAGTGIGGAPIVTNLAKTPGALNIGATGIGGAPIVTNTATNATTLTNTAGATAGGMSALTSGLIGVAGNIAGTVIKNKTNDNSAYTATNAESTGNVVGSGLKSASTGFVLGNMILPGVGGAIGAGLGAGYGALKARKQNKTAEEEAARLQREQAVIQGNFQTAFINSRAYGPNPGFGLKASANMPNEATNQYFVGRDGGALGIQEDRRPKRVPGGTIVPIEGTDAVEFKGRSHKQGGIIIDKNAKGEPTVEVEDDEVMLPLKMKDGKKQDYIFSDYLKIGNESFAQKSKKILKGGGTEADLQQLAVMQEKAAGRNPQQIAQYGGVMRYDKGGPVVSKNCGPGEIYNPSTGQCEPFSFSSVANMLTRNASASGNNTPATNSKPAVPIAISKPQKGRPLEEKYEGWKYVYDIAKSLGDPFPELTASQWAQESGWGESLTGRNNPFGQTTKDRSKGTSLGTPRDPGPKNQRKIFIDYDNYEQAILDHLKKWKLPGNSKKTGVENARDAREAVYLIQRHGENDRYAEGYDNDWESYVENTMKIADAQSKRFGVYRESTYVPDKTKYPKAKGVGSTSSAPAKKTLLPPPPVAGKVATFAERNNLPGIGAMQMNEEIQMPKQPKSNIVSDPTGPDNVNVKGPARLITADKDQTVRPDGIRLFQDKKTKEYIYRDGNNNEIIRGTDRNALENQIAALQPGFSGFDTQLAEMETPVQRQDLTGVKPGIGTTAPTNAQAAADKQTVIAQQNGTTNAPASESSWIDEMWANQAAPAYNAPAGVSPTATNGGPGTAPTINNQNSTYQYTAQTPGYLDYNDPNTAGGIFSGDRYEKDWKPLVGSTMADAAKADQVINYLTNYTGTDADDVKAKIAGKNRAEQIAIINDLATDTKVGPFHNAVFGAMQQVNSGGGNVATNTPPVIPPVVPPSTTSGTTATTKRYTACPPGTYLSTDGTCKETPKYSKPYDGNIAAAAGAAAQLIPPIYAALNPYERVGSIAGAPSVRGALLGRKNFNAERSQVADMNTATNEAVTNANTGAAGFAIRQAAMAAANKQMLAIAKAEGEVNTELRGKEAVLGQDASKFNAENVMKRDMFNADLKQKQNQYVDERNVGIVDALGNRLAGAANTYNQYKATDALARATNANTNSLERYKMYESLLKDSQKQNSQFYGASDAELRRIAAGLVEEQTGGVGKTGGVRQYISRLGELKSARATKAKL